MNIFDSCAVGLGFENWYKKLTKVYLTALFALCIVGLSLSAYAMPPAAMPDPLAIMTVELSQFAPKLNLSAQQLALWEKAEQQAKIVLQELQQSRQLGHLEAKRQLADENISLRTVISRLDQSQDTGMKKIKIAHEAWFAALDSLNGGQYKLLRQHLMQTIQERDQHMEKMRSLMGPPL